MILSTPLRVPSPGAAISIMSTRIQTEAIGTAHIQRDRQGGASTRQVIAVCGFLAVAVLLLFSRTLSQGFFTIDDNLFVHNEPHVSGGLTWSGFTWAFTVALG